jgi:hypothetical protein
MSCGSATILFDFHFPSGKHYLVVTVHYKTTSVLNTPWELHTTLYKRVLVYCAARHWNIIPWVRERRMCPPQHPSVRPSLYLSIYLSTYLSIFIWLYSPFVGPWPFISFLILYPVGRSPWRGDKTVARPQPTHRIHANRQPYLKWDSNPRPQRSSERRQFIRGHCDRLAPRSTL